MVTATTTEQDPNSRQTILERLAVWGCELYRVLDNPLDRDPIGRLTGPWDISGTEYYLADYIEDNYENHIDGRNKKQVIEAINGMQAIQFELTHDALATRLEWRGYHLGASGWAANVKLHDVWKYRRCWTVLDALTEHYTNHDWSHIVASEWDWFLERVENDNKALDPKKFRIGGNGGWLLYAVPEMDLDQADELYSLYETIPALVAGLCQQIATDHVASALAELWDVDCDEVNYDNFTIQGVNFQVDYNRDMK